VRRAALIAFLLATCQPYRQLLCRRPARRPDPKARYSWRLKAVATLDQFNNRARHQSLQLAAAVGIAVTSVGVTVAIIMWIVNRTSKDKRSIQSRVHEIELVLAQRS